MVALTVKFTDAVAEPPAFTHVKLYVFVPADEMVPVLCEPLAPLVPLQEPPAVHELGLLLALQPIVELAPAVIVPGETVIFTTGLAGVGAGLEPPLVPPPDDPPPVAVPEPAVVVLPEALVGLVFVPPVPDPALLVALFCPVSLIEGLFDVEFWLESLLLEPDDALLAGASSDDPTILLPLPKLPAPLVPSLSIEVSPFTTPAMEIPTMPIAVMIKLIATSRFSHM